MKSPARLLLFLALPFFTVALLLAASEPAASPHSFGLYLIEAAPSGGLAPANTPLADLTLVAEPLFSERDVAAYDWESHTIRLKQQEVADRALKPGQMSRSRGFVVVADGQRLYRGTLLSPVASSIPDTPVIHFGELDREYQLQSAVRIFPPMISGKPDPRSDPRLKRVLEALQLLTGAPGDKPASPAPASANAGFELTGVSIVGEKSSFALQDPATADSRWLALGQSFAGWKLTAYDPATETLTLTKDSATRALKLKGSAVRVQDANAASESSRRAAIAARAAAPAPMLAPPAKPVATTAVFGPVTERELGSDTVITAGKLEVPYLDLESGLIVKQAPPGDISVLLGSSDPGVRYGVDFTAVGVAAARWDAPPGEVLAELARAVPQKTVELRGSDKTAPQTVFFQTREGTAGTLQVLPMPEKRGVVTIRYKLLQPGGAAPSPQAP